MKYHTRLSQTVAVCVAAIAIVATSAQAQGYHGAQQGHHGARSANNYAVQGHQATRPVVYGGQGIYQYQGYLGNSPSVPLQAPSSGYQAPQAGHQASSYGNSDSGNHANRAPACSGYTCKQNGLNQYQAIALKPVNALTLQPVNGGASNNQQYQPRPAQQQPSSYLPTAAPSTYRQVKPAQVKQTYRPVRQHGRRPRRHHGRVQGLRQRAPRVVMRLRAARPYRGAPRGHPRAPRRHHKRRQHAGQAKRRPVNHKQARPYGHKQQQQHQSSYKSNKAHSKKPTSGGY